MNAKFNSAFSLVFLLSCLWTCTVHAQNSFPANGNVQVKGPNATVYLINDSQSIWSRAGLVLNNPYQALTTNLEFLYEKNGAGSTGTSSGIIRKNNASGYLNYIQFNDANNSIYFLANRSGSQSFGNVILSNGNFLVGANGKIGIGTDSPTEKLEVNGTIRAKEIKLEATNWPDYVFGEEHKLMPLDEVKAHIDQQGHLPGLKSAKEYHEQGVNMLELNQKLLEKVEELTLYILMQNQTLIDLNKRLDVLEAK